MTPTKSPKKLLTDLELEMMQVLWDKGQATVREVLESLPKERKLAYTTVATVLTVLEKKRVLLSRKTERAHYYSPIVSREAYETKSVQHLIDKVFRGTPSVFVMKIVNEAKLSPAEIEGLRKLLKEMKP